MDWLIGCSAVGPVRARVAGLAFGGAQAYRAPELCDLYSARQLDEAVDVWALACIFVLVLYHVHPFQVLLLDKYRPHPVPWRSRHSARNEGLSSM